MLVSATSGIWHNDRRIHRKWPVYGLSWDHERVYLGMRYAGGAVLHCSPSLEDIETIRAPMHDIHQMLWADGMLYFANTHEDLLEGWDGQFSIVYASSNKRQDTRHLNSIWIDDNGKKWMVEHGRGEGPARVFRLNGWSRNLPGEIGAHNVYVENGYAYVLAGNQVIAMDVGRKQHMETVAQVPDSYLRGFARGNGKWYVGRSLVGARHEREDGDAHVLVFDNHWNEVSRITLPSGGQVHEVRLLEGDRAHNGLPYPGELPS